MVTGRVAWAIAGATALLMLFSGIAGAGQKKWAGVAGRIEVVLTDALKDYENERARDAMEGVVDAYFGVFEGEGANMEIAVRRFLSIGEARRLEKAFTSIRRAMHDGAPAPKVRKDVLDLVDGIKKAAAGLDEKGVSLDVGFN